MHARRIRLQLDQRQQTAHTLLQLLPGRPLLVSLDGVGDLGADTHHGVERVHDALGDQRDAGEAHASHLLLGQGQQPELAEVDPTSFDAARWSNQPHQGHGGGGLAGAGLAHEPQPLACAQFEVDALHGSHGSPLGVIVDAQLLHPQRDPAVGAHEVRHRRGLAIRSNPMEMRKSPTKISTIMTMGGAHHHQIPRSSEV